MTTRRNLWRTWRGWRRIDVDGGAPDDVAVERLHRRLSAAPAWVDVPEDLLAQTLWSIADTRRGVREATALPRGRGAAWAMRRAVARAAAVIALIGTAAAATGLLRSASTAVTEARRTERDAVPALPASNDRNLGFRAAMSSGVNLLEETSGRASLLVEARRMAADAEAALLSLRAQLPRRPRLQVRSDIDAPEAGS